VADIAQEGCRRDAIHLNQPRCVFLANDGLLGRNSGPEVRFREARAPLGADKVFPAHAAA
jgi:hypothetical protein